MKLSVILPTYNESAWLSDTLEALDSAIVRATHIKQAEIIVINDGSTDNTKQVLSSLKLRTKLVALHQKNAGRFLARKAGIETAKHDFILFIDSRVHIDPKALDFVSKKIAEDPAKKVWNAHVHVVKKGNPYARFWDAITFIAWRRYFANPRETSYGPEEFDHFPKGTTCFIVPKSLVAEAIDSFRSKSKDAKAANDDTLMIKYIVNKTRIHIAPSFSCKYHSRSSLNKFLKHAFHRGKVFVDGFLRADGNRYFLPLVIFLVLTAALPLFLIFFPSFRVETLLIIVGGWLLELVLALGLRVKPVDALVLFGLTPLFAIAYGAGIWSATLRRIG